MSTETIAPESAAVAAIPQKNVGNTVRASWKYSLDDIRPNIQTYNADAKAALVSAFLWCIDPRHPVSQADFARRVGTSENTLYKLYQGKYIHPTTGEKMGPSAELVRNINKFLELEKERFISGETQLVITPTLKKIVTACELARESNSIVFLVGPSHIGKTKALKEHYTPNNNHGRTVYTRLQAASGLGGMIRRIAECCGVSPNGNTADLVSRIKNALTRDMLLIIDEVHLLAHTYRAGSFHNCMEVIREIHDETGCGMVLCFTMLDQVKAASQKELQQLWRRGVHKVQLPAMPTKGDLAAILEHNGLEFPAATFKLSITFNGADKRRVAIEECPYEILRQVSKQEALLAITERLRYARKLANKADEKLSWKHFVTAHLLIAKQSEQETEWA
jgi:DNA transposition AAA+ family ATPase